MGLVKMEECPRCHETAFTMLDDCDLVRSKDYGDMVGWFWECAECGYTEFVEDATANVYSWNGDDDMKLVRPYDGEVSEEQKKQAAETLERLLAEKAE